MDESAKKKRFPVVGVVVRYFIPHSVWSGALVGNTCLDSDIRLGGVGITEYYVD
jgi:hypothetical protein